MKRLIESGLVITLTVITVFAMITVKAPVIQEEPVFMKEAEDIEDEYGKPEGTGYLFEDYDKEINIPFEGQEETQETNSDNKSSMLQMEDFKRVSEREVNTLWKKEISSGVKNKSSSVTEDIRSESKVIISKVKNNISLEDKLSLLKIVSSLSLKDLNDIKNAVFNGTTNAESIKLWTMLRNKLPHEEYKKLENIITKYE